MNAVKLDANQPAIVREAIDLRFLAAHANNAHHEGEKAADRGLQKFREAGEVLIRAKAQVPHGQWEAWVQDNLHFSLREAQRYMRLAREWPKATCVSFLEMGLQKALAELAKDVQEAPDPASNLCKRCQRVGAVQDCPECKSLKSLKEAASKTAHKRSGNAAEHSKAEDVTVKDSTDDEPLFSLKAFRSHLAHVWLEVDKLGPRTRVVSRHQPSKVPSSDSWMRWNAGTREQNPRPCHTPPALPLRPSATAIRDHTRRSTENHGLAELGHSTQRPWVRGPGVPWKRLISPRNYREGA